MFRFDCRFYPSFLQVLVVPFMSGYMAWRDTTILILAVSFIITGFFLTAFSSETWVLYICYGLFMLWNTVTTTCRSNLSKLLNSKARLVSASLGSHE